MDSEITEITCRHEFVRIYQRKLKGLERRLVATKAYLPVGFKATDFSHLGEGSFCFCSKCRLRLFPRRTNAEKAQARLANALSKQQELEAAESVIEETMEDAAEEKSNNNAVSVEELEIDATELDELETGNIDIATEEEENL